MTKVKATALKQLFSSLFKNGIQTNTQVQFDKHTISKSIDNRLDNNVVESFFVSF